VRVPHGVTLLLGGARSGKSTLAVGIGRAWPGAVTFVATARLDDDLGDDDLAQRVARHRAERPPTWTTIEPSAAQTLPLDVCRAVRDAPTDALVIVDCVTLWIADELVQHGGPASEVAAQELARTVQGRVAPTVLVSNEVGLGVHPDTALGREFRDVLGRANAALAAVADRTLFLVAGRAVRLDDPWELLA
jgi:adenosylcobinamide kinase/adenosylcobinamide-phosphate guanylyltransferase